jgi:hypothetical protein
MQVEHLIASDSLTVTDILNVHPKPWATTKGDAVGLNETGFSALMLILLLHDGCVDCEKANQYQGNKKLFMKEIAAGAGKFIEQHREHCCVPGLTADTLAMLMVLFKMRCLHMAGVLDENGEPVN